MTTRLIILISFTFFFLNITAQNFLGFTKKVNVYPQDIRLLFGHNLTEEEETLLSNFTIDWKTNAYDSIEKQKILNISIQLFNQKGRVPHFKALLLTLDAFKQSQMAENKENYLIWLNYMTEYLSAKKVSLSSLSLFLETIINVVKQNLIFNTNTIQWKVTGSGYTFKNNCPSFCISFPIGSLKCFSKQDSIQIDETSGIYYPFEKKWVGKNGSVTWERAGFKPSEVNAKLKNYTIDVTRTEYKADSVIFTYGKYFNKPVMGQLIDKVLNVTSPESAVYPEFDSYNKRFIFKNLYPNLDYDGGFSMRGAKIIGSGSETEDAKIFIKKEFKRNNKIENRILMQVFSKYFVFRPQRVNGINTAVTIKLEQDSIYHSDLSFIYLVDQQEVNLIRSENYSSQSPYYDSYHKLNMDFEQLTWRIDQPKVKLTMPKAASIGKAKFESESFFNLLSFEDLQGHDAAHPLVAIRKFSKKIGSDQFRATLYADYVGRSIHEVNQVLMEMAKKGYIYYNSGTDMVSIRQRLIDCLKSAAGTIDYDVVKLNSETQAPLDNAVLDMDNFDLVINGIPRIAVSDSQNVVIYPSHEQITMKENRSFQFDGKVVAGLFTVYGKNFFFNYDAFKINLQNVDSVSINVYTGEYDEIGRPITRNVKNVIQHITGELRIDKPNNKSGLKNYPEYPLFASRENSFVYYNSKEIENGVYPQESFYFELYPFEMDSLDNFKKEGMTFRGKFQSSGILPPIEQLLVLQPDLSLGFKHNPGPGGIPVYGDKGQLYGDIQLSNKGLRANGNLHYVTSTTVSKDFKFYPDSMNTLSEQFTIERQLTEPQFPKVNANGNYIHWTTASNNNNMYIYQGKAQFNMFNNQTNLTGSLTLNPIGLTGKGFMNLTSADLQSRLFKYKAEIINADTSKFLLRSLKKEGYTVLTEENVNSHIDFSIQKGEFTANEDYTKVDFPENKYISYLDYFKWNMDDKTLEMSSRRSPSESTTKRTDKAEFERKFRHEEETEGPRYISVHNKQDSLNFVSPNALYDYQGNVINASNVKLIRVADAIVYPADGKVTVLEAAQMKTLFKAKIVANHLNKYHTIYAADINIHGRQSLTGQGKYDYIDETKKIQTIHMDEISVDENIHTIAKGNILETDSFTLSPYFGYLGKVTLNSTKPLLYFNGGVSIMAKCERPKSSWLKFESEIDPKNILIPVSDDPVNINNNKIYSGIYLAPDSIHIYPAFISGRRGYNDKFIAASSGFLRYNKDSSAYEMASMDRLLYPDSLGNYLSLHRTKCMEYGEGRINLGIDLGQMKLSSYGNVTMNIPENKVKLDVVLNVDFMFDPTAMKTMATKIDSFPKLDTLRMNQPMLVKALADVLGKKRADKYRDEVAILKKPKEFPAPLEHTISFTSLQLEWDNVTHTYYSVGKIGVGSILNYQVNRMVDGYVQLIKKRTGDIMDIYLKLDDNNFYYFGYTRSVMQAYSTNSTFLNILRTLPVKVRQMDVPRGAIPYIYMVSSDSRFGNFLRDYKRTLSRRENNEPQEPAEEIALPNEQPDSNEMVPENVNAEDKEPPKEEKNQELKKEENEEKK